MHADFINICDHSSLVTSLGNFFDPHPRRLGPTTHIYGQRNMRQIRGVLNAHFINCAEQKQKSYANYFQASQVYLALHSRSALKIQYHHPQLAYNLEQMLPLGNTIATLGPLHVSLNGQENVALKFTTYHHLFNKQLAKKKKKKK